MKTLFMGLCLSFLFAPSVMALPNCHHSNSWQCQQQGADNNLQNTIQAAGETPSTTGSTPVLGAHNSPKKGVKLHPVETQSEKKYEKKKMKGGGHAPGQLLSPHKKSKLPQSTPVLHPYQVPTLAPQAIPVLVPIAEPFRVPPVVPVKQPVVVPSQVPPEPPLAVPPLAPPKQPSLVPSQVPPEPPLAVPPQVPPKQPSLVQPQVPPEPSVAVPPQALPQQPVVAPQTVTSVPPVIYVGTQNQITKPGDAGISAASHLLLNSGITEPPQKAHYLDMERALSANRESHDKTVDGFSFEVVGIRLPEHHYNFVRRPIAHPETFVFYFDFASSTVHEDQWPVYDRIVEEYGNRGTPITVIGETDGFGSEHFNALLAQHRSEAIIRELIRRGIPTEDIDVQYDIRCCRQDPITPEAIQRSLDKRITWVHFD